MAVLPQMSISRNFMLGMEPIKWFGPLRFFDEKKAGEIAREELAKIGITVNHLSQKVGTMSGGERQSLAIAHAEYRGARLLILDEPTSALGVNEAAIVLRHVIRARARGLGVIIITHNVHHALPIGDRFVILSRGRVTGTYTRSAVDEATLQQADGRRLRIRGPTARTGGAGTRPSPAGRRPGLTFGRERDDGARNRPLWLPRPGDRGSLGHWPGDRSCPCR